MMQATIYYLCIQEYDGIMYSKNTPARIHIAHIVPSWIPPSSSRRLSTRE